MPSRITVATLVARIIGIIMVALFWAPPVAAQSQMALGGVTSQTQISCPSIPSSRNFDPTMTAATNTNCYTAKLQGCPGVADLDFVFAYAGPTGGGQKGTIVMLSGDGGEKAAFGPAFSFYVPFYEQNGYQVVEIAWGGITTNGVPWELANPNPQPTNASILNAACRPATFLNWVRNGASGNVGKGIWGTYKGGMCAHGDSGGAAALGYSLAWYGAGVGGAPKWGSGYLDKVVLENGPVFTDIDKGCQVTCDPTGQICGNNLTQSICVGSNQNGGNPNGCNNWTAVGQSTNYPLEYVDGAQNSVNLWSGNTATGSPACANNMPNGATTYDVQWQKMSIDYVAPPAQPSYNYPNTGMSAWLCETLGSGVTFNNATAEGGYFYQNFTAQSQAANELSVNGVTQCLKNAEDIESGQVYINGQGPYSALVAIENDMTGVPNAATSCQNLGAFRPQD